MNEQDPTYNRHHMCMNIAGALRNHGEPGKKGYRSMKGMITDDNGNEMSDKQVRTFLAECLVKGWRVIPVCADCEGFDYFGGGCPGHPITKEEYELSNK